MSDATQVLEAVCQGDPRVADQLVPLVYEESRKLDAARMAHEKAGNTLQPMALVHEAWLRLAGNQKQEWEGRAHFFAAAAEAMRRSPIDRARRKRAARHGGDQQRVDFQEVDLACPTPDEELLALGGPGAARRAARAIVSLFEEKAPTPATRLLSDHA